VLLDCRRPVNNSRELYNFSFDGILAPDAKQDEVRGLVPKIMNPSKPLLAPAGDTQRVCLAGV
jgi:hypothetical protein